MSSKSSSSRSRKHSSKKHHSSKKKIAKKPFITLGEIIENLNGEKLNLSDIDSKVLDKAGYNKEVLGTFCPRCGVGKGKVCISQLSEGGPRPKPHDQRLKVAAVEKKVEVKVEDPKVVSKQKEAKNPLSKCTPEQKQVIEVIVDKTQALGAQLDFCGPVTIGPYVTTYRFKPGRRTKVKKIEQFGGDYAVALGRESVLVKMMPGDSAIGVFVANEKKQKIEMKDTLPHIMSYMHQETEDGHIPIPLNFGMDVAGKPAIDDLTTLPHLMMAGTTGSGKSTEMRALILSMAFAMSTKDLRMIISDTKVVEFPAFKNLPHLVKHPSLGPDGGYCSTTYQTMAAMQFCIEETKRRYEKLAEQSVQNIHQYNAKVPENDKLPQIVLLIDELADLLSMEMGTSEAKANAAKLKTITSRSRAAGIYVVAATQRPDVKTVVGAIKANFPARLSLRLPSHRDSATILGTTGAQNLMSRGDMLYISSTSPALRRLHAPWTSFNDVKDILESIMARESLNNQPEKKEEKDSHVSFANSFYKN